MQSATATASGIASPLPGYDVVDMRLAPAQQPLAAPDDAGAQGRGGEASASDALARVRAAQGAAAVQTVYADVQAPNAWWASVVQVFSQAVELGVEEYRETSGKHGDTSALPIMKLQGLNQSGHAVAFLPGMAIGEVYQLAIGHATAGNYR